MRALGDELRQTILSFVLDDNLGTCFTCRIFFFREFKFMWLFRALLSLSFVSWPAYASQTLVVDVATRGRAGGIKNPFLIGSDLELHPVS